MMSLVIQGAADSTNTLTQAEFSKTVEFLDKVMHQKFAPIQSDEKAPEEAVLAQMRNRQSHLAKTMDDFTTDVVDGRIPNLEMGKLGLVMAS
jgi:ABC-type amino acid transport substrate-binding protein